MAWTILDGSLYVDTLNGNDTTGTGTQGNPFATIQKGIDELDTLAQATEDDYKLVIGAGVYEENLYWNYSTISNINNSNAIIEGDGLVVLEGDGDFAVLGTAMSFFFDYLKQAPVVKNITVQNYPTIMDSTSIAPLDHFAYLECNFYNGNFRYANTGQRSHELHFCTFTDIYFDCLVNNARFFNGCRNCNFRGSTELSVGGQALSYAMMNCDFDGTSSVHGSLATVNSNVRATFTFGGHTPVNPIVGDPLYNLVNGRDFTYQAGSPNIGVVGGRIGAKGHAPLSTAVGTNPLLAANGATQVNITENVGGFVLTAPASLGTIETAGIDLGSEIVLGRMNFFGGDDFKIHRLDAQAGTPNYSYELTKSFNSFY